jgi:hypothetical protein
VAGGKAAFLKQLLDWIFEFQQADGVGDGGAVFAGALGDLFLGELKFVDEALESVGLFDGVKIFALQVFYQRHFQGEIFGHVAQYDWYGVHVCALGGAPAALAGDELVAAVDAADDERLNDAARLNGAR